MDLSQEKREVYEAFLREAEKENAEFKAQREQYDKLMGQAQSVIDKIMQEVAALDVSDGN